jgi:hypothetical protein
MGTIPQFLCFRYKGLKRPDQITSANTKIGWSFRKWQKWEQVHIEPGDKALLKTCGDTLVDQGDFNLDSFGRISEILLNVARWQRDRENLAIPPDPLPAWNALYELMKVFSATPSAVAVKMQRDIGGVDGVAKDRLLDVFYWHLLTEYFQELKHPQLKAVTFTKPWDLNRLEQATVESIRDVYVSVGLRVPEVSSDSWSRKLVSKCYQDLGFSKPIYDQEIPWGNADAKPSICNPLISFESLGALELLRISHRESALLLCINKDHELVKAIDHLSPKKVLELLLSAYAESVASFPNKQDELKQVSTLLGMKAKHLLTNCS